MLRKLHNITQAELGKALGLCQSTMSRMAHDLHPVKFEDIKKMARLFNVGLEAFDMEDPNYNSITILLNKKGGVETRPPSPEGEGEGPAAAPPQV